VSRLECCKQSLKRGFGQTPYRRSTRRSALAFHSSIILKWRFRCSFSSSACAFYFPCNLDSGFVGMSSAIGQKALVWFHSVATPDSPPWCSTHPSFTAKMVTFAVVAYMSLVPLSFSVSDFPSKFGQWLYWYAIHNPSGGFDLIPWRCSGARATLVFSSSKIFEITTQSSYSVRRSSVFRPLPVLFSRNFWTVASLVWHLGSDQRVWYDSIVALRQKICVGVPFVNHFRNGSVEWYSKRDSI
jgi:hypothetical protein